MKRVVVITREPEGYFSIDIDQVRIVLTPDEYQLLLETMRVFCQLQAEKLTVDLFRG